MIADVTERLAGRERGRTATPCSTTWSVVLGSRAVRGGVWRGDSAAAERGIRVAQRLDPNCLSVVYAKSVLAGQSGDTERATKLIRDAVTGLAAGSGGLGAVIGKVEGRGG